MLPLDAGSLPLTEIGGGGGGGGGDLGAGFSTGHMCIVISQPGWTTFSQTCGRIISPSGPIRS